MEKIFFLILLALSLPSNWTQPNSEEGAGRTQQIFFALYV